MRSLIRLSGGVMLHSLSVAPMPVPTDIRVPVSKRPYASQAIEKTGVILLLSADSVNL
jgi:hypothetical protein